MFNIFVSYLQYKATDFLIPEAGKLEMKFTPAGASEPTIVHVVHNFDGAGVAMGMYNTDKVSQFIN